MEARQLNADARLLLSTVDSEICLSLKGERVIRIGRLDDCELVLRQPQVSRLHGRIESEGQYFFFYDLSSNGSFFKGEDERVIFIRRQKVRLWGAGVISLGSADFSTAVIALRHLD